MDLVAKIVLRAKKNSWILSNLHSYAVAVDLPLRSDHVDPLLLFIAFKRLN